MNRIRYKPFATQQRRAGGWCQNSSQSSWKQEEATLEDPNLASAPSQKQRRCVVLQHTKQHGGNILPKACPTGIKGCPERRESVKSWGIPGPKLAPLQTATQGGRPPQENVLSSAQFPGSWKTSVEKDKCSSTGSISLLFLTAKVVLVFLLLRGCSDAYYFFVCSSPHRQCE